MADESMAQAADLVVNQVTPKQTKYYRLSSRFDTSDDLHEDSENAPGDGDDDDSSSASLKAWYENPPRAKGPPKPFKKSALGRIPQQFAIRSGEESWDTTAGSTSPWASTAKALIGRVCRGTRMEIFSRMQRYITIAASALYFGSTFKHVPHTILRRIHTFHLYDDGYFDHNLETTFPKVLGLITSRMPKLVRFQLESSHFTGSNLYSAEAPTLTDRLADSQRSILRFGAFLIAKMKDLDMLVWPGDSRPSYEPDQDRVMIYVEVASSKHFKDKQLYRPAVPKYLSTEAAEQDTLSLVEDRLLNATALRRLHWDDILALLIDDLTVGKTLNDNSELDEGDAYLSQVDNDGYMTRSRRRQLGKPYVPIERLIDICEKWKRMAIQNGTYQPGPGHNHCSRGLSRGRDRGLHCGERATGATNGVARAQGTVSSNIRVVHSEGTRGRGSGRGKGVMRGRGAYRGIGASRPLSTQ
ncbi:hypothetical protein LTS15_008234 [Exophiala xenobiotica]|nr:hypothetical protein LTS15_008234 [Exophiala xenobiotica]